MAGEMVDAGAEDQKRKKILDGVRVFVLREGVSSVTMEQIAARQGISKKTLYKYFANKDQLIAEAIEERIVDIAREITAVVEDRGRPFPERMSRVLGTVGDQLALIGDRLLNDLVYREPRLWERIDRFRREHVFVAISRLFEEGIRAGFVRTDIETRLVPILFVAAVSAIMSPPQLFALTTPPAVLFQTITRILLGGVLTEEGRAQLRATEGIQ
jgi:AcrR family transcriptional regulator